MTERARPLPPTMRPALGPELPSHGDPLAGSSGPSLTLTPRQFTLQIVERVAAAHGVHPDDIFGERRTFRLVIARHEAMADVVEARPHWSYPTVGRLFNRDHSTVMSALRKLGKWKPRKNHAGKHHEGVPAARAISAFVQSLDLSQPTQQAAE